MSEPQCRLARTWANEIGYLGKEEFIETPDKITYLLRPNEHNTLVYIPVNQTHNLKQGQSNWSISSATK